MLIRILVTLVLLAAASVLDLVLSGIGTIGAGQAAGLQLQSNDAAYLVSQGGMKLFSALHIPWWLILGMIAWLWWKPLRTIIVLFGCLIAVIVAPNPASAYYDKLDYAEPYFIMPNESAFWVPDVGDNKNSQVKFGSEEYFQQNKIAAKRFVIPHTKLDNSGLFSNYYVPAGRLIIVDRTPYSREWVGSFTRGSSNKDQSFPCQSKEGLNITVGIAIGVSVLEDSAAKFLYRFGANPPEGNRADPNVVFQSVLHSRSLTAVMDSVGRNKVQALVCNEIGSRTFDQANQQASDIMKKVRGDSEAYFASVGITLDYLGWADTMTFDESVQKALNDRYIADKVGPVMGILTQNAENAVKEGLGKGLATKGLPTSLVVLPQNLDLTKAFSGPAAK